MKPRRTEDRFAVAGLLLAEAYSCPPGAFEVAGDLTISGDALRLARCDAAAPGTTLVIEFARVVASRVAVRSVHVEWDAGDGIVSSVDLTFETTAEWTRFTRVIGPRLDRAASG